MHVHSNLPTSMCGIIGSCHPSGKIDGEMDSQLLSHRGPDAQGSFRSENGRTYLGHARLAIVDPYENSNQPFRSADGRYVLVYNGEVYNHKELATKHALATRTSSDTEVVVELYSKLGPGFLGELNGMFAGAIYDKAEDSLFLFRDRLGIKPLYYSVAGGGFAFCSELPPLVDRERDLKLREQSLADFLHFGYVPEPHTLYEKVFKFPAGHWGTFEGGRLELKSYWKAEDQIRGTVESEESKVLRETEELLRDSVRMRLMADVPFGTFLSGGADSGLISALAADLSGEAIQTFNVSFEDNPFDESPYASRMAEAIGARHRNIHLRKEDVLGDFDEVLGMVGEPFADSSLFPTLAVSKFAAEHVKMALSGDGGDELFLGYGSHTWAKRLHHPVLRSFRKVVSAALRAKGGRRNRRAANVFDVAGGDDFQAHIHSQEQNLFSAGEVRDLLGLSPTMPDLEVGSRPLRPEEVQAFFELTHYLKDDLLVKVDRASMRHGLEVRVPFLDHHLVGYALNVDPDLKRKGGESKYLVKKIMERHYPKELVYREKWGFSAPLETWLKGGGALDVESFGRESLDRRFQRLRQAYQNDPSSGHLYNRLYALKCLSVFHVNPE